VAPAISWLRFGALRRLVLPAAVALCIAAVAGCGGDTPARAGETPAPAASGAARTDEAESTTTIAPAGPPSEARVAELQRTLREELRGSARDATASAAAAAVIVRGHMLRSAVGAAPSAEPLFSLASLTKPFIAVLTLRLAEERRLSLTDTVGRWLGLP
jgi:CubicO group peptidase (beta-lactamase class C family)